MYDNVKVFFYVCVWEYVRMYVAQGKFIYMGPFRYKATESDLQGHIEIDQIKKRKNNKKRNVKENKNNALNNKLVNSLMKRNCGTNILKRKQIYSLRWIKKIYV